MIENISTISLNEIFEKKQGCPVCGIYFTLEMKYVDFIVGDAMMEPGVRVEVNSLGFCPRHFKMMLEHGSRLPVALMLETHLEHIDRNIMSDADPKKRAEKLMEMSNSCYVCERINKGFDRMLRSLADHWHKDEEFRALYLEQEYICARHCAQLLKFGLKTRMKRSEKLEFCRTTSDLTESYLSGLRKDISHCCSMYDYRNRGGDWGNSRDAIERSISFLDAEKSRR